MLDVSLTYTEINRNQLIGTFKNLWLLILLQETIRDEVFNLKHLQLHQSHDQNLGF